MPTARELALTVVGSLTLIAAAIIQGPMPDTGRVFLAAFLFGAAGTALWNAAVLRGRRTATDDQIEQRALREVAGELSADAKRWRARGHRQRADEFLMAAVRMRYAAEKRRHRATTTEE